MIIYSIAEFYVENVSPIRWNKNAFSRLVLPYGYKEIIRAFVQEQLTHDDDFDDIIYGKGEICCSVEFLKRDNLLITHT